MALSLMGVVRIKFFYNHCDGLTIVQMNLLCQSGILSSQGNRTKINVIDLVPGLKLVEIYFEISKEYWKNKIILKIDF